MTRQRDLESRFGWLSVAAVVAFGVLLAIGLLLHVTHPEGSASRRLLEAGLVTLMLGPALRLALALAERLRRRDWPFVVMTLIVVIELTLVMWRAATKSS